MAKENGTDNGPLNRAEIRSLQDLVQTNCERMRENTHSVSVESPAFTAVMANVRRWEIILAKLYALESTAVGL